MAASEPPSPPVRLFIIVVVIAAVVSITIGYLGITGRLGGGIPGEKPPASSGGGQLRLGPIAPAEPASGHPTAVAPTELR